MGYQYTLHAVKERPVLKPEVYPSDGPTLLFSPGMVLDADEAYLGRSSESPLADCLRATSTLHDYDHWALSRDDILRALRVLEGEGEGEHWSAQHVQKLLDRFPDAQWFVMTGG